jgi:hypothetical protein
MRKWILPLLFAPALVFPVAVFLIALRNPSIFRFFEDPPIAIAALFILTIGLMVFLKRSTFLHENIHGLILFLSFAIGYFLLTGLFNKPEINTNNIFFGADNWSWLRRMAFEDGWDVGTRAVHPFTQLIFRPLIVVLSIFNGGDRFEANFLVLSLAGGGCVFLMWKIIRQISADEVNAILFASLLGLSASHLIFAAVVETYIFSAFCLLLFIWLVLNNQSVFLLTITSLMTFGITITNFAQQGLTLLLIRRNLKQATTLFIFTISLGIGLNIFSKFLYPSTEYVFLPENLAGEQRFQKEITFQRAGLMAENLFIYNIAAPQPYTDMRNETVRFNFLNGTIGEYRWFGWPALILWLTMAALAFFYFPVNLGRKASHGTLAISMLACLVFNFLLHIGYGAETFLYSADWTYALVLFTAINLSSLSDKSWFKITLFSLVSSVFLNNMWFLYLIAAKVSEHFGK